MVLLLVLVPMVALPASASLLVSVQCHQLHSIIAGSSITVASVSLLASWCHCQCCHHATISVMSSAAQCHCHCWCHCHSIVASIGIIAVLLASVSLYCCHCITANASIMAALLTLESWHCCQYYDIIAKDSVMMSLPTSVLWLCCWYKYHAITANVSNTASLLIMASQYHYLHWHHGNIASIRVMVLLKTSLSHYHCWHWHLAINASVSGIVANVSVSASLLALVMRHFYFYCSVVAEVTIMTSIIVSVISWHCCSCWFHGICITASIGGMRIMAALPASATCHHCWHQCNNIFTNISAKVMASLPASA